MHRLQTLYPWSVQAMCNISILQPMELVVRELNSFEPTLVATYPSVAIALAAQQEAGDLHIAPHAVGTGGENFSAAARARVAAVLQCPVANHYGASEFLNIASECSCGHLHANTDWLILEPVDLPLQMRGNNGKRVTLLPLALTTVLEEQAGFYEFQLQQRDAQTLELQLPQNGAAADVAMARGAQALQDFALQRGKSGKVARVIAG